MNIDSQTNNQLKAIFPLHTSLSGAVVFIFERRRGDAWIDVNGLRIHLILEVFRVDYCGSV